MLRWIVIFFFLTQSVLAATPPAIAAKSVKAPTLKERLEERLKSSQRANSHSVIFDLPVTYNARVSHWIQFFQTRGKRWFREWLERSTKYMPAIHKELRAANLPQDLAFMVMIESGFEPNAVSHAAAVGPWQFIQATGNRYGLQTTWWLDERRDLKKSTLAATRYLRDLYKEFGSWYLVAASYNMGENGLRRQIKKHKTKDFWALSKLGALPKETVDYVPKILAAMMISKAPSLYGFNDLSQYSALEYDFFTASGGTDLRDLAREIGVTEKAMKDLNAELVLGYVPTKLDRYPIRIPKGSLSLVADYARQRSIK